MNLMIFGLHYEKTPVAIRERAAFRPSQMQKAYEKLVASPGIHSGVILSTCNRSQLICHTDGGHKAREALEQFYLQFFQFTREELKPCSQLLCGSEALHHFFATCCGLNSLVVGEDQILGQVKEAWFTARDYQATDKVIHRLFQEGVALGKKVRSVTRISETPLSVASIAVKLGEQTYPSLEGKKVLVIGRGEMARLTLTHLLNTDVAAIFISSRYPLTLTGREKQRQIIPVSFEERYRIAAEVDWVISATSAPHIIFDKSLFLKEYDHRPLLLTDIAMPRDLDPELTCVPGITLYDLDMLHTIVQKSVHHRKSQLNLIRQMIAESVTCFQEWFNCLPIYPRIQAIREYSQTLTRQELDALFKEMPNLSHEEQAQIEAFVFSLTKKMWRTPIHQLKQEGAEGRGEEASAFLDRLLNLAGSEDSSEPSN